MANEEDNKPNLEIFTEILASDKLGGYQNWSGAVLSYLNTDDPGFLWEQLKWNPWLAMAIFEDMEDKDGTLFSCLEKRRDGVLSLPRYVKPASDKPEDVKIAEFVEDCLENYFGGTTATLNEDAHESNFENFLSEALEAVGDGVTIGEIIFAEATDRIYIKEVKFKPQHLFSFGETGLATYSTPLMMYPQTGKLHLRTGVSVENFGLGAELPENKFFVFSYQPRKGNRWGSPLKRKCFWQAWLKKSGVKGWLRYIEKGSGTVVARYNDSADATEQQNAVGAATAVQEESAVAIPKKFLLEVHEMVRNIGSSHKELVDDYCNAEISRIVVGQTLTGRGSDGGGSRALGQVHERVESKKIEKDAKGLMAVVNKRLVRPLVVYNFGPKAAMPEWILEYEPGEDLNTMAERYSLLRTEVGLPLSKKALYEAFQTPEPIDKDDTLDQPQPQPQPPQPMPAGKPMPPSKGQSADFSEKKTLESGNRSNLKTERLQRLRPSQMKFSDE